jgi:hypothetical protein
MKINNEPLTQEKRKLAIKLAKHFNQMPLLYQILRITYRRTVKYGCEQNPYDSILSRIAKLNEDGTYWVHNYFKSWKNMIKYEESKIL